MVQDIRGVKDEEYWAELRRRWGALLSYRYIGRQFSSMNNVGRRRGHPAAPRHAERGGRDHGRAPVDQLPGWGRPVGSRGGAQPRDPCAADSR